MSSFQRMTIAGIVAREPRLSHMPSGEPVCTLLVAVKKSDGETDFFLVVFKGDLAEKANQSVHKGMHIAATGEIDVVIHTGNDKQPHATVKLFAKEAKWK